ncbi:alpha-amylase family protein [Vibrio anguillarum]|uniref:alpha-amylase family protein n=1 Tax=Vibrio anguillarum TaxID=55601 RepID=UPI00097E4010|nr:alpha-amylase family protein [Vibrio anguillarum]MBT2947692.1 alpha-amylase family protein [Vibrio anguillarum]
MTNVQPTDVILHAFDWPYRLVAERAEQIFQLGYKTVLISPPMKSFKTAQGTKWWQRYQPQDYRIIDNQLGNTHDFKQMVETLTALGLRIYADVVFNHMANESKLRLDLQYPSAQDLASYQNKSDEYQALRLFGDLTQPLFDKDDFVEAFGIKDWKDRWQVQNGRITGGAHDPGLPTLRDNEHVVVQQQAYLRALKALGVKGFRIDAAKHMSIEHLKKVWADDITQGMHIFGEIITDGGATKEEYQLFLEPYLQETKLGAYDFPLFQTVYDALQTKGSLKWLIDPYCFGQALSNNRAITFTITHDIPNNAVFADLVMDEALENIAYSYILGRDGGVPLIYTDLNTSGILNHAGLPRWQEAWCSPQMAACIAFHNKMHALPMKTLEASDDLLVFSRGKEGIVVLNKSQRSQRVEIDWTNPMLELFTKQQYQPNNQKIVMDIAARSSAMLCRLSNDGE